MKANSSSGRYLPRLHPLIVALACCVGASAEAQLPTGFDPVRGGVTQQVDGRVMRLNQQGERAIVNWKSFSIGAGNTVRITQPGAGSMMLNRVTGAVPSRIAGSLTANGKVFLVNPNGVMFGAGARVSTGGLVASTLNLSDDDFTAGRFRFEQRAPGNGAAVVNQGTLHAHAGGTVALLGGIVRNEGTIRADAGTVALVSARKISVDFAGDGLTTFRLDAGDKAAQALAENAAGGILRADGGRVAVIADAAQMAARVVNVQGVVRARTLSTGRSGEILLQAGQDNLAELGGTLDATGMSRQDGGRIEVRAGGIVAGAGAVLDASGGTAGGRIALRAQHGAALHADSVLRANATQAGTGGAIDIQGGETLRAHGVLQARGAGQGAGGFIETSAHAVDLAGVKVDTRGAGRGTAGTWLIDPYDITVAHGVSTPGDVGLQAPFVPIDGSLIYDDDINRALNSGNNVVIQTGPAGAGASDEGSIQIGRGVAIVQDTGDTHRSLRFDAHRQIEGNDFSITSSSGALDVIFNSNTNDLQGEVGWTHLDGANIRTNGGNVLFVGQGDLDAGRASADSTVAVHVRDSTIDTRTVDGTGTGGVVIRGESRVSHGQGAVRIEGSTISTDHGDVTIAGRTPDDQTGVVMRSTTLAPTTVNSQSGDIRVYGSVGHADAFGESRGVLMQAFTGLRTETGNVDIRGRAEASGSDSAGHRGVSIESDATVVAAAGDVSIAGEVAGGAIGPGIMLSRGGVVIEGGRSVTLRASASHADSLALRLEGTELRSNGQVNLRPGGVTAAGALRDDTAQVIQVGSLPATGAPLANNFIIGQDILDSVRAPALVLGSDQHAAQIRVVSDVSFAPQSIAAPVLTLQAEGAGGSIEIEAELDAGPGSVGLLAAGDVRATGSGAVRADHLLARSTSGEVTLDSVADGGAGTVRLAGAARSTFRVGTQAVLRLEAVDVAGVSASTGAAQAASATGPVAGITAGNVRLTGSSIGQAAGADIEAAALRADAVGSSAADVILDNGGNRVGQVAGQAGGEFRFTNAGALAIGQAGGAQGIQADQVRVRTLAGDLTLAAPVTARRAVLVAAARFQNPAGTALDVSETWQVWADTWRGENRGGLAGSGNYPNLYGCAYGGPCVTDGTLAATQDDNHFVYRERPVAQITPDDQQMLAGEAIPPLTYTVDGLILGDTQGALSGSLSTSASSGSPPGNYAITGSFVSDAGYDAQVGTGTLTVQARPQPTDPAKVALTIPSVPWERTPPSTWLYDRNLSAAPMCFAQGPQTRERGQQGDILAREWALLRARPNLTNCVATDRNNACADF